MPDRFVKVSERGYRIGEDHQSRPSLSDCEVDMLLRMREDDPQTWTYARLAQAFEVSKSTVAGYAQGRRRCQTFARFKPIN